MSINLKGNNFENKILFFQIPKINFLIFFFQKFNFFNFFFKHFIFEKIYFFISTNKMNNMKVPELKPKRNGLDSEDIVT